MPKREQDYEGTYKDKCVQESFGFLVGRPKSPYNHRKAAILDAIERLGPGFHTVHQITALTLGGAACADAATYAREYAANQTRCQWLNHRRDIEARHPWGYAEPYLARRKVWDATTKRWAAGYRMTRKGRRVLGKIRAGELAGPTSPRTPAALYVLRWKHKPTKTEGIVKDRAGRPRRYNLRAAEHAIFRLQRRFPRRTFKIERAPRAAANEPPSPATLTTD